jgi:hypothetical protein
MRIIVIALTAVSATLAGTTVYFARELKLERERSQAPAASYSQTPPAQQAQLRLPAAAPSVSQQAVRPPLAHTESEEADAKNVQIELSRRTLKMLADPTQREGMLLEQKVMLRGSYPRLAQAIGLTNEEAERLFTLLAQQQIDFQEKFARCAIDPNCNAQDFSLNQTEPGAQEIADLLGADRQQQFEAYKNTLMERESVVQLRTRLPDTSRLPDERAEALIAALADERQKIHMEAAQRGAGMNSFGTGAGMIFSASDAATLEAQLESAQANSRRMRTRAAEVLDAEQLRVFDEMQEEIMISLQLSLQNQLRSKEEFATNTSFATATTVN